MVSELEAKKAIISETLAPTSSYKAPEEMKDSKMIAGLPQREHDMLSSCLGCFGFLGLEAVLPIARNGRG